MIAYRVHGSSIKRDLRYRATGPEFFARVRFAMGRAIRILPIGTSTKITPSPLYPDVTDAGKLPPLSDLFDCDYANPESLSPASQTLGCSLISDPCLALSVITEIVDCPLRFMNRLAYGVAAVPIPVPAPRWATSFDTPY